MKKKISILQLVFLYCLIGVFIFTECSSIVKPINVCADQAVDIVWTGNTDNIDGAGALVLRTYLPTSDDNYHYIYKARSGNGAVDVTVDATTKQIIGGLTPDGYPDYILFRDGMAQVCLNGDSSGTFWPYCRDWKRNERHGFRVVYHANRVAIPHGGGSASCTGRPVCSTCGRAYGNALGHAPSAKLVAGASCTSAPIYHDTCNRCGAVTRGNYASGNALGHISTPKLVSDANCTNAAVYHDTCNRCGAVTRGNYAVGNALGHIDNNTWITDLNPSCDTDGLKHTNCSRCGANLNSNTIIPALGHLFGNDRVTKYPTIYEDGVSTQECSRCGLENLISKPHYNLNIFVNKTERIKAIAKGNILLFVNTDCPADALPFFIREN